MWCGKSFYSRKAYEEYFQKECDDNDNDNDNAAYSWQNDDDDN